MGGCMKVVNLSKNQFYRLSPLPLETGICNSEGDILEFQKRTKSYILKKLKETEGPVFANKLYTIEMLDAHRDSIPSEFTLPTSLLSIQGKLSGFVMPKIQGVNLQTVLDDPTVDAKEKIYYLKTIGQLLEKIKHLQQYGNLSDFHINDLHESNIIINPQKKEIHLVDTDSCKIAGNKTFFARYLSPSALLSHEISGKYPITENNGMGAFVDATENTDLYCYMIMILNFLSRTKDFNFSKPEEFYSYLTYLSDIGIDKELIDIFANLLTAKQNQNPYHLLDTLSYEQLGKASKNVFSLKKS